MILNSIERQERLERKLANLDAKRKDALERRDAIEYVELCDKLGIVDHEAPDLYEQGLMERDYNKKRILNY